VREFVERAFGVVGRRIDWRGEGLNEVGVDARTGAELVHVDPKYFRPTEVDLLLGDPAKAKKVLGWSHKVSFQQLVEEMVQADLTEAVGSGHGSHGGSRTLAAV
jgi:GDPmannose 4,6-dehydratase